MPPRKKLLWKDVDPTWQISDRLRDAARDGSRVDPAALSAAAARLDRQDNQLRIVVRLLSSSTSVQRVLDMLFSAGFDRTELVSLYGFDEDDVIQAESRCMGLGEKT